MTKFSELALHPAIAAALNTRGYETATPVQSAVLDPAHLSRDLLVSSQTGSGKTIAFGAALTATLLAPDAPPREQKVAPVALVIVPTRELAVQVREELTWLLRDTGLRLASFTGGTAVSGDLRVLQRGVDLVIGTPGRLVDLLKRDRLQLTHVRVVVLDEADEMLDLGFREDLEKLLQAAPATRRTLLLSATLPSEIQALARRFQRDAVRIDPRKDGDPAARQAHNDITYVAHLIAAADRLAVVVNVLRAAGTGRAIVFCTTREAVSRLHTALVSRGFSATAISGDRAQAERDRALDLVRRGDARILVATNVAARGLHLPDVDLIIHADLPLNAESLTHRSGRTGRAGRKGTAVVLASLSERRKAERLLALAHVPAVWTAPPSAESITAAARDRLADELLVEAAEAAGKSENKTPDDTQDTAASGKPDKKSDKKKDAKAHPRGDGREEAAADALIERLEATLPARELARRLLVREFRRLPGGERINAVPVPGPGSSSGRSDFQSGRFDGDDGGRKRGRADFSREGVMFRVNIGAKENADPRWVLPLICRRGGVTGREVGSIRIGETETRFEIAGEAAADFAMTASERDPRAPNVVIERVSGGGAPGGRQPERSRDRPIDRPRDRPMDRPRDRPAGFAADRPRDRPTAFSADRAAARPRYDKPAAPRSEAPMASRPNGHTAAERSDSAPPARPHKAAAPASKPPAERQERSDRPAAASRTDKTPSPRAEKSGATGPDRKEAAPADAPVVAGFVFDSAAAAAPPAERPSRAKPSVAAVIAGFVAPPLQAADVAEAPASARGRQTDKGGRGKASAPVIEMKRAPQMGRPSSKPEPLRPMTGGPVRPPAQAHQRPERAPSESGFRAPPRSGPPPAAYRDDRGPSGPRPDRGPARDFARPSPGPRRLGPPTPGAGPRSYGGARPQDSRGPNDRPRTRDAGPRPAGAGSFNRRDGGTGLVKRASSAAPSPSDTSGAPDAVPTGDRSPFWKDGARRRASAPPPRHAGPPSKGKPSNRAR